MVRVGYGSCDVKMWGSRREGLRQMGLLRWRNPMEGNSYVQTSLNGESESLMMCKCVGGGSVLRRTRLGGVWSLGAGVRVKECRGTSSS